MTMTPDEVVRELIERFSTGRFAAAFELYAADAEVSIEFAVPERIVLHGTQGWGTAPPRTYDDVRVEDLTLFHTDDPALVVAQWTYVSRVGDAEVANGNIIVVEVRDGLIVRSRDYHDHIKRAVADGTAHGLIDQIRATVLPGDPT